MQRTLSEGARKKQHKRKLHRDLAVNSKDGSVASASGQESATPIIKRKKRLEIGDTPQTNKKADTDGGVKLARSEDDPFRTPSHAANAPRTVKQAGAEGATATRRLEFTATPSKPAEEAKEAQPQSESSSSSSSEDEDEHSSASSDECEVTFDAMTLGNMRIVREASESPLSMASTGSTASMKPIGLEYRFSVASTVSSIAVAPNGKFLVVGFYNGTIYLYPLTRDSLRFRTGVLLDHISARGMYTQLMVRVALPEDGKFIFAGVYRGSTEIRAFEVDSIKLPSIDNLQPKPVKATTGSDSEESDDDDPGVPTANAITHTYSDAKLKGFSDVKSVIRKPGNKSEYHLLCGLGIKNIHLWRFFRESAAHAWSWECVFDKQSNGISIELLCFHRDFDNQIVSKSEHQNIRIWNLEVDEMSCTMKKKSHVDVKQTVDATAIYGDHAYGGGEALALIDLRSSSRMELDLPLSEKEQAAKKQANSQVNSRTRITASMRGRRGSRRGGVSDDAGNGQRLMRMVSQVAGQDSAPFVVGMCTDGSVFMHRPQPDTMGLATPLEYVEGYEHFFQDPSLSFQAQFSDLTRVNTSGLLAVVPLPKSESEDWMIVAANAEQLLVRSMKAFLYRSEHKREYSSVKRGLRDAMRDMGKSSSESESESSGSETEIEVDGKFKIETKTVIQPRDREQQTDTTSASASPSTNTEKLSSQKTLKDVKDGKKASKLKPLSTQITVKTKSILRTATDDDTRAEVVSGAAKTRYKKPNGDLAIATKTKHRDDPTTSSVKNMKETQARNPSFEQYPIENHVTTPTRTRVDTISTTKEVVPSPVVSISSPSSASSNANTPEHIKRLPPTERRAIQIKELAWSPAPKTGDFVARTTADSADIPVVRDIVDPSGSMAAPAGLPLARRGRPPKKKTSKPRARAAQALFVSSEEEVTNSDPPALSDKLSPVALLVSGNLKRQGDASVSQRPSKIARSEATYAGDDLDDDVCTDAEGEECDDVVFFTCAPLCADGGSLLAAAMFKYDEVETTSGRTSSAEHHDFTVAEMNVLTGFGHQMERMKRNYVFDRERIVSQVARQECECGNVKKKSNAAAPKLNWRKQIAGDVSKKKHMKRRQKKQLAAKLKELQITYASKINDIRCMQRLELQAFTARQEFQLLLSQV